MPNLGKTSETMPVGNASLLPYRTEAFADIAIQNAIWLTGEWLSQGRPSIRKFAPDVKYVLEPRQRDRALAYLEELPRESRLRYFARAFIYRPHVGGEHLFKTLVTQHSGLLVSAFDSEWQRTLVASGHAVTTCTPQPEGNRLLPKPAARQLDSKDNSQGS